MRTLVDGYRAWLDVADLRLLSGGFEDSCGAVEGLGEGGQLGLGPGSVGGFDGFVDAGDDDGGVAGELAGGVYGVFEPGAFGQTSRVEKGFFGGS